MILQRLNEAKDRSQQQQKAGESIRLRVSPSNDSTTMVPKSLKLEFPRFRGEDPLCWVYKANQYFQLYNTPLSQRILLASYHMEDEALVWFQDAEEPGIFMSWDSFVKALIGQKMNWPLVIN